MSQFGRRSGPGLPPQPSRARTRARCSNSVEIIELYDPLVNNEQMTPRVSANPFGWGKTIGGLARPMLRGVKKLDFKFTLTMAAYDLIKLPRLIGVTA